MKVAALLALLATTACAHAPAFRARSLPSGGAAAVALQAGLLVTTTDVAGHPIELVVDLAATHPLTLPAEALARVGARPTGDSVRYQDATGTVLEARVFTVSELTWAGVTWRDVRAVEARWSPDYAPPVRLGVLGLPLLRGLRVALSVASGAVTLAPESACPRDAIRLDTADGLVAAGRLDDDDVAILIDTAATGDIATTRARGGRHRLWLGPLDLGEIDLVPADLPAVPADVILGTPFLAAHGTVIFDLGAGCATLRDTR